MSPKPSLRVFLRKDILRNRITAAPLRGGTKPTSKKLVSEERHGLDCLFHEDTNAARERGNGDGESEVDAESLFGEPVCKGKSAGEKRKEELRRFLSESIQSKASVHKAIESPVLRSMRKDLEDLVTKEGERCLEGRGDVRSQKRDLIRRIAALEAEEKRRKVEELKCKCCSTSCCCRFGGIFWVLTLLHTVKLDEISRTLPALGPGEEKTLRATAEKASNAFAGLEVSTNIYIYI
ncbi:hypothetical protein BKA65DRAFT_516093 [Rhexocercosporidium sp. MPI-PUGE-AT-0058]|nr:hypothetical protein BKA65DRAFT_516093 [Rhexocercosporidium sp. MPI-PUGE-AT-0058]